MYYNTRGTHLLLRTVKGPSWQNLSSGLPYERLHHFAQARCRSQASSSFWGHLMSRIIFWELKMWPNSLGWSRIIQETGPVITWHRRRRGIWSWKMYPWPDTRSFCNRHKGDIPRQWIDSLIYFSGIKNSIDSQEISQYLLNNTHTQKKENVLERNKQSAKCPIRHPDFLVAVDTWLSLCRILFAALVHLSSVKKSWS